MSAIRVVYWCCLSLTVLRLPAALSQQTVDNDEVKAFQSSCKVMQQTLQVRAQSQTNPGVPTDDDYVSAGEGCDQLNDALSRSDPQLIGSAVANLRPALARLGLPPTTPQERFVAAEKESSGASGKDLFYQLPELTKRAFNAGAIDKAEAYAQRLLQMAPEYPKDWNYGNAIFYGNFVLGRIAVQQGDVAQAGRYLLAAGATPGSPQLDSFGPNMTLAKELVEKGQSDVVLQYLRLCRHFWKAGHGKLNEWSAAIRAGRTPAFDSNLNN